VDPRFINAVMYITADQVRVRQEERTHALAARGHEDSLRHGSVDRVRMLGARGGRAWGGRALGGYVKK